MHKVMVIGIAGGTGSGKTTITRRLMQRFGKDVCMISYDNYYKARHNIPFEERAKINYDHPDAFDTELFLKDLRTLKAGKPIQMPLYDYAIHDRLEQTKQIYPAKVILVAADEDAKEAEVIVPDHQLSLAIGKEGQNARLAARLTGYRIDIKSETEARESGLLDELEMGYQDGFEGYTDEPLYGGDADMEPAEYPEEMPEETEEMQ